MIKKNINCIEINIKGMKCPSCEILLERKLKKVKGVSKAEVKYSLCKAKIHYENYKPQTKALQSAIEKAGYSIYNNKQEVSIKRHFMELGGVLIIVLGLYILFGNSDTFSNIGVEDNMSYAFIFAIGIVAAFSSCLAVTGGLLVSITAKYSNEHPNLSGYEKFKPQIYFNIGRILGYVTFGALIGLLGSLISISNTITGIITIFASLIMVLLGLQLLNILPKSINNLIPRLPKSFSHKIFKSSNSSNKLMPFTLGGATFFLPCGFTYALQLYVLSKADPVVGALTMFAFALGTLPGLLSLGILSSFLTGTAKRLFFKTAGVSVILLGILTIPSGLALAGFNTADNNNNINTNEQIIKETTNNQEVSENIRIENGVQIVEMQIRMYDYYPHQFTIYKGMPVEWRIDASKAAGCAKVMTVPKLSINEYLSSKEQNIITFTPEKIEELEFMCSMAMTTKGAKFKVIENPNGI